MFEEPEFDENLWCKIGKCCPNKHFLYANPHAFTGSMNAWCPGKKNFIVLSKSDIEECSLEATYWVKGFLNGNEPDAPRDEEGAYLSDESKEFKAWLATQTNFLDTGIWKM
jgi:hypothetical protein